MAELIWRGPVQGIVLVEKGRARDIMLIPGHTYHLPEKHPSVRGYLASGLLVRPPKTPNPEETENV